MRKIVIGVASFVAGVLMTASLTAYGADISKVGKKITGEYSVSVNGSKLAQKAVAVDGTTYAPLRAIGESLGYDVTFQNKQVQFTKKEGEDLADTTTPTETAEPTTTPSIQEQIDQLENKRSKLIAEMSKILSKGADKLTSEEQNKFNNLKSQGEEILKQIEALKAQLNQ